MAIAALALCLPLLAPSVTPAADALVPQTRTLFLSERFTATSMRAPLTGAVQPHRMLALRGEREGFQLALRNTTAAPLELSARVVADAALAGERAAARIDWELLRVAMVSMPRGSTGLGTRAGMYADPLPPLGAGAAGRLRVEPGHWGAMVLLARIRTDASPGSYGGTFELFSGSGASELVHARQPFTLSVRRPLLMQPGARGAFRTVLFVEGEAYWLQHDALRNGPSRGYPTHPDRMRQLGGLMAFLDSRGVTPLVTPLAYPAASGRYDCSYDVPGDVPAFSFARQLDERYFGRVRDIDPAARQFPSRFMPTGTPGCNPDDPTAGFHATQDLRRTPTIKQDDFLHPAAPQFFANVASAWRSNGWFTRATYALNPFDEPGDGTATQRQTMNTQVPAANVALHRAARGQAKVVLASWPRDNRRGRACSRSGRCMSTTGDQHSNRRMWDGRGLDEVDVWMPPFSRLYGRTPPKPGFRRDREYAARLATIRRARAGRETWAYNFYTATRTMPQLTIDAPGTDARLQYWLLARDGHTGLFVSNVMLGWGGQVRMLDGSLRHKGNPYDEATYFRHKVWGDAAGWGTFIYPGYRPELGLTSETARNTDDAKSVSSLRLEGMRDGQEDANLAAMYRARFGNRALMAQMRPIFPGAYRPLPRALGNVVFPTYANANLAQRLEARRRAMIQRLSA